MICNSVIASNSTTLDRTGRMGTMKPLEGITVLEFSTMITASFAAMMMAEQGARVIKIEPTDQGDPMRYIGSSKGAISGLFANCNR